MEHVLPDITQPVPVARKIVKQTRAVSQKRVFPASVTHGAPVKQHAARIVREGNSGGGLKSTITSALPPKTDSAGGGSIQPSATETAWHRQYRLRKEAMMAAGVKAGCRGCGGV